jgi:hypothetical protein
MLTLSALRPFTLRHNNLLALSSIPFVSSRKEMLYRISLKISSLPVPSLLRTSFSFRSLCQNSWGGINDEGLRPVVATPSCRSTPFDRAHHVRGSSGAAGFPDPLARPPYRGQGEKLGLSCAQGTWRRSGTRPRTES